MSTRSIQFSVQVAIQVKQEGKWFIASCPALDVHSQGQSEKEALHNIGEAIQLFIESCYERGVLEQVLKQSGFQPGRDSVEMHDENHVINVPLSLVAKNAEARSY